MPHGDFVAILDNTGWYQSVNNLMYGVFDDAVVSYELQTSIHANDFYHMIFVTACVLFTSLFVGVIMICGCYHQ